MGFLIGIAGKLVGERIAPFLAYGFVLALLAGGLLWLRADAYSDGEKAEKVRWEQALREAEDKARAAAKHADKAADARQADYAEQVRDEKEKIDAAIEAGTDPFDVLFPGE